MEPSRYDALLVLSFGGPEKAEDVIPFLENVLRGRNVPHERMLEVAGIATSGFGEGEAFHRTSPDGVRGEKAILHSPEILRSRTGTRHRESWRLSRISQYANAS